MFFFHNEKKAESMRRSMETLDKYEACRLRSEAMWNRISGKPIDEEARKEFLETRNKNAELLKRYEDK